MTTQLKASNIRNHNSVAVAAPSGAVPGAGCRVPDARCRLPGPATPHSISITNLREGQFKECIGTLTIR